MYQELDNYIQRLQDQHARIKQLIRGLDSKALNWRPIESTDQDATNSLAVLAAHVCGSEHYWIAEVIGRLPPTRNREAEFATHGTDADSLSALIDQTQAETIAILTHIPSSQLDDTRVVDQRTVFVRWAILQVIVHTALHFGHMQITYQLYQGGKAFSSPFWYESLPGSEVE